MAPSTASRHRSQSSVTPTSSSTFATSSTSTSTSISSSSTTSTSTIPVPLGDRIRASEHQFTSLTQNIAHFSPLKHQLDKHNLAIERLEGEVKKKTTELNACQDKLKAIARRPQSSRQGSHISLHLTDEADNESLLAMQRTIKEALDSLNGQLLAAKILHIGLTRQVAQYFESRSQLQKLLEEIFSGSTPEHPSEDALEQELAQISANIIQIKEDFEKHKAVKSEFKEVRRYVDIWNDAVEKQIASNVKDVGKTFKKFVPFMGPKPPSYTRTADYHMDRARALVPTLEDLGLLSHINMNSIADTSSELGIYTAKFRDMSNNLSLTLESLQKRSRILKKKRNICMEKLFEERCRIFSGELQAHYRSIGASLASPGSAEREDSTVTRASPHRQHVEGPEEVYSSEGGSSLGPRSQENRENRDEELPSYFQHHHDSTTHIVHERTGSLGSPARSSSASSSLSLNSPQVGPIPDSPPDYERNDSRSNSLVATLGVVEEDDAMFQAYHQRYDTRRRQDSDPRTRLGMEMLMDTPPGYEETRHQSMVDPV